MKSIYRLYEVFILYYILFTMSTIVRYFVPEDRDVEDKPNAFILYKIQDDVRLNDIIDNFPLPGEYHFRFKTSIDKKNIWVDFSNKFEQVPTIENKIILKVTRISWNKNKTSANYSDERKSNAPDLF